MISKGTTKVKVILQVGSDGQYTECGGERIIDICEAKLMAP